MGYRANIFATKLAKIDANDANCVYKGDAPSEWWDDDGVLHATTVDDPLWSIQRITTANGVTTIETSGGDNDHIHKFSERASLTYR